MSLRGSSLSPASVWTPEYLSPSAWLTHAPFAFWLTEALRPRRFVELGTYNGFSFFAFCQAIERLGLNTSAFAVDTWQGDEHAGLYDESVFAAVSAQNDRYRRFAALMRMTFDDALSYFDDGSIDLLHIDGMHSYRAVSHDYESWLPRLTDQAVVLFHDTNVRERDFGVWRFFDELRKKHPSFAFTHGHGLGIVCPTETIPEALRPLLSCGLDEADDIRLIYSALGADVEHRRRSAEAAALAQDREARLGTGIAEARARDASTQAALSALQHREAEAEERVAALQAGEVVSQAALKAAQRREAEAEERIAALQTAATSARAEREQREIEIDLLRRALKSKDALLEREASARAELASSEAATHRLRQVLQAKQGEVRVERMYAGALLDVIATKGDQAISERSASGRHSADLLRLAQDRADRIERLSGSLETESSARASAERRLALIERSRLWRFAVWIRGLAGRSPLPAASVSDAAPSEDARLAAAVENTGLFDRAYYLASNPDVAETDTDPALHFARTGWKEGRKPNPYFDPAYYLAHNSDVVETGENPLFHYARNGIVELRRAVADPVVEDAMDLPPGGRRLVDDNYYTSAYPDVAAAGMDPATHFFSDGWREGRRPSPRFDPEYYLAQYPDVLASGENPVLHFADAGAAEGRLPFAGPAPGVGSSGPIPADVEAELVAEIEATGLFDPEFYRSTYPDVIQQGIAPALHFATRGWREGRRPSAQFDPAFYLAEYPDVKSSGVNPLLHFAEHGIFEGRQAHPDAGHQGREQARISRQGADNDGDDQGTRLAAEVEISGLFDPENYAARRGEAFGSGQAAIDRFARAGMDSGDPPSPSFGPALSRDTSPDVTARSEPPFWHPVRHGRVQETRRPDQAAWIRRSVAESGLFDATFYRALYPDVVRAGVDPLDHYLGHGVAEHRRPSIEFDADAYLQLYPDVAADMQDALVHYVLFGQPEGRSLPAVPFDRAELAVARLSVESSELFDAVFYRGKSPALRDQEADPVLHYLVFGYKTYQDPSASFCTRAYVALNPEIFTQDIPPLVHHLRRGPNVPPPPRDMTAVERFPRGTAPRLPHQDITLERMAAASFFARYGFTYEPSGPTKHVPDAVGALVLAEPSLRIDRRRPDVSIVIPVYGQMPFVLSCLDSLSRHASRFSVEIILSDDVSPPGDMTHHLAAIPWVRYVRRGENGGFLDNCNAAAAEARGRHLVLLNSDTRLVEGWLDELIGSFDLFPKAGFVGSKLVNADGSLQEAGGIYWSDGTAWNYGRGEDAEDPRYNFARQVDWVSGAAIAVPRVVWREVGGFDDAYRPAYCEDVDLAFRIRERGYEIWYQPLSCVIHYEGMTHGRDDTSGIKAHQIVNLKRLQQTWSGRLPGNRPGGQEPDREANRSTTRRMLVVDANTHMPDKDAGSFVASQMMRAFGELGYHLSFVPLHNFLVQQPYTADRQRVGIEMLCGSAVQSFSDVLRRSNSYDYVLMYRYGVVSEILDMVRTTMPTARVIFSNVDLHYLRMEREATVTGDRSLRIAASRVKTEELGVLARVDCSLVHTPIEREIILRDLPASPGNIVEFPWISDVKRSAANLDGRRHIMFLGGFAHAPNVDAVQFFVREVWPLVVDRLDPEAKFLIVGNGPTGAVRALASDRIVVTGLVPELPPYFDQARVFVAPLRFGAGIKGKLIESLANGAPSVATAVASEGIGLTDGQHYVLADTAEAIAEAILSLYRDDAAWHAMQEAGYHFVDDNFSWRRALALCRQALDVSDSVWLKREARSRDRNLRALTADVPSLPADGA